MAENTVNFDGSDYMGSAYITSKGDTVRIYSPVGGIVPNDHLYTVEYRTKKGETEPLLITTTETGGTYPTNRVRVNHTSDWGKTIDYSFLQHSKSLPITMDVSQKPWWNRWLYSIFYNQKGGRLQNFINNAYAGQDYSGAMGAGSMGLQKIQRKKEEIAQREGDEVANQYENQAKTFAGIGALAPLVLGGQYGTVGPFAATLMQPLNAGIGYGVLDIALDKPQSDIGKPVISSVNNRVKNTRFNYNTPASKKEGGNINYSKLFVK